MKIEVDDYVDTRTLPPSDPRRGSYGGREAIFVPVRTTYESVNSQAFEFPGFTRNFSPCKVFFEEQLIASTELAGLDSVELWEDGFAKARRLYAQHHLQPAPPDHSAVHGLLHLDKHKEDCPFPYTVIHDQPGFSPSGGLSGKSGVFTLAMFAMLQKGDRSECLIAVAWASLVLIIELRNGSVVKVNPTIDRGIEVKPDNTDFAAMMKGKELKDEATRTQKKALGLK